MVLIRLLKEQVLFREIYRKLESLKSERKKYNGITEKDFYSPLDEKSNNLI